MFKKIINKKLLEEKAMQQQQVDDTTSNNRLMLLALAGLTIVIIVFSVLMTLQYRNLEHEYTLLGCELSCAREYNDLSIYSSGYYPTDEGIKCICYDIRVPPQRRTPLINLNQINP
jgi:hypothetical protein